MSVSRVDFIGDVVQIVEPALQPFGYAASPFQAVNSVRFESSNMELSVTWDTERDSYLHIEVRERGTTRVPFQLEYVYEACEVPDSCGPSIITSRDYQTVLEFVRRSVAVLTERCGRALSGDQATLRQMLDNRQAQAVANLRELVVMQERRRLQRAWTEGRLEEFLEACSLIEDDLSPAEQAKVRYAKRKLNERSQN